MFKRLPKTMNVPKLFHFVFIKLVKKILSYLDHKECSKVISFCFIKLVKKILSYLDHVVTKNKRQLQLHVYFYLQFEINGKVYLYF